MTRAEILEIRSLHDKQGREELGLFICEGHKIIKDMLNSPLQVDCIYTTIDQEDLPSYFQNCNVKTERISIKEMSRISALKNPTDIFATVRIPQHKAHISGLNLVLDGVQDPGNMGTIIRIADWFGINDIYCSKNSADCFNPKVVQATMGSISRVRIHYHNLISLLQESGMPIYGTFAEGTNIYNEQLSQEGFIVMGSEGKGLSKDLASMVTHKLFIPPFPADGKEIDSLNVATATAIVCSEFRRRN